MPADNWKTIWFSPRAKFKRRKKIHFVTGFYLKQHRKNKQIRLVQWLKNCMTQKSFYANIPIEYLLIDLRKFLQSIGKRIRKRSRGGTV